jgi:RNA polymerase sigma factor (sigma-70 family)
MTNGEVAASDDAVPAPSEREVSELLALLERIETDNPVAAARALAGEIDTLLGRQQTRKPDGPSSTWTRPSLERRPESAFEWWGRIVDRLPPVLSHERTIDAAKAIEAGLFAEEHLHAEFATLTRMQRRGLQTVADIGHEEFELLILSNLRLVFHWCKGVARSVGLDWVEDAFQSGCLGLMRGLQGWDYAMGYALSTFVSWHIRQSIQRWRMNEVAIIRVPVHVWEKLRSESPDLSSEVEDAARSALTIEYLDDLDADDLETRAKRPDDIDFVDEMVLAFERRRAIDSLLSTLDDRSADVIRLRNGLGPKNDDPLTLDVIGVQYGVTRERIRQIEKKAMESICIRARELNLDQLL